MAQRVVLSKTPREIQTAIAHWKSIAEAETPVDLTKSEAIEWAEIKNNARWWVRGAEFMLQGSEIE